MESESSPPLLDGVYLKNWREICRILEEQIWNKFGYALARLFVREYEDDIEGYRSFFSLERGSIYTVGGSGIIFPPELAYSTTTDRGYYDN